MKILLERAIAFEERAYRFYEEALARSAMGDTSELLGKLLADELLHRIRLEEMQRTGNTGRPAAPPARGKAREEPRMDEPAGECPHLHPWAVRGDVLAVALRKETAALRFYRNLARKSALKAVRGVFEALSAEESAHVEWIRKEMQRAGG